jgi:Ser/Thr protein kinase RdoA (MazF antagonist)
MLDEEKLAVVYKAALGIHLPRGQWNNSVLKNVGKQIGKMHRVTQTYRESTVHIKDWYENKEYAFLEYVPKEETAIRETAHNLLNEIKNTQEEET